MNPQTKRRRQTFMLAKSKYVGRFICVKVESGLSPFAYGVEISTLCKHHRWGRHAICANDLLKSVWNGSLRGKLDGHDLTENTVPLEDGFVKHKRKTMAPLSGLSCMIYALTSSRHLINREQNVIQPELRLISHIRLALHPRHRIPDI